MLNAPLIRRRIFLLVFRLRVHFRYIPNPLKRFVGSMIVTSLISAAMWQHFGTDICLPILADMTPILLAIVGIIMSYIQPKRESPHNDNNLDCRRFGGQRRAHSCSSQRRGRA